MLPFLEQVICLLQQSEQAGISIVNTKPLEVVGPSHAGDVFAEIVHWLRRDTATESRSIDELIHQLCGGSSHAIDWKRAFPDSPEQWALTPHELGLLQGRLSQAVWIDQAALPAGRLEGVAPGSCFITPTPYLATHEGLLVSHDRYVGSVVAVPSSWVRVSEDPALNGRNRGGGGLAL